MKLMNNIKSTIKFINNSKNKLNSKKKKKNWFFKPLPNTTKQNESLK